MSDITFDLVTRYGDCRVAFQLRTSFSCIFSLIYIPPFLVVAVNATLLLLDEQWTDDLENTTSNTFLILSGKLKSKVSI